MKSSYSSSTVTDDQKYDSANPPPPSSEQTPPGTEKYDSANPPPPSSEQTPPGTEVPWSTGLCSCFDDLPSCFLTSFCPRITSARIATIVDKREISSCFCHCDQLNWYRYRTKLREQYSLKEDPCNDHSVHFWCPYCALCQEYRELKHRGFDMSIGWQGNVEKQRVELAKAPVVEEGMTR